MKSGAHLRKIISFIFAIFFINIAYGSPATELSNLLNSVRTMRASFTQTIYDNRGKAIQQSNGNMALQRPGKFRWEVKKPIPQIIVANDTRLWIYDPDLEQVTIRSLKQTAGETPALLLSHNNSSLENDFSIKTLPAKTPASSWFSLKPKMADSMFESIEMGFANNQISEMRLQDHIGHTTDIKFTAAQTNTSLPATLFNFKPPKNVDVIDETKKSRS